MSYEIEAYYSTGDSENTYETTTTLPPVWDDVAYAKKALRWLVEHNAFCDSFNDDRFLSEEQKELLKTPKEDYPWYYSEKKKSSCYKDAWLHTINLELDDHRLVPVHIPYYGYFEHIIELRIVESESEHNGMVVRFQ